MGQPSPLGDLCQEQEADYRVFDLHGDHYKIGYEMGRRAPMRVVRSWGAEHEELAFAQSCAEQVFRFHAALPEEMWGYAAGQGRSREEVLSHFSLNLPEGALSGCTTLALRLSGGQVLVARNYDFLHSQRQRYLRRLTPLGYPASLGTQAGLIGSCYDGVNTHGLFVALHLIHAQIAETVPPGVPYHLMPRILLETCEFAREAVAQLREMPHLFPFNYLVADSAEMYAVEAYPGRVRVRAPENGHLIVTNYYAHPDMRPLQGRRTLTGQEARVAWIERRIAGDGLGGPDEAWVWAQQLLRNHSVPVCHHRATQATLWSIVADLSSRRVAYSLGAPCRNAFVEYEWPQSDGSDDQ